VASPIRDSSGEIVRSVLLYHDITELMEAKAAVAEEKERLFFTLASIAEGVIATDPQGRISLMNQVAEKLTGWSSQEAAGKAICEVLKIFDEENRQICLDILSGALLEEEARATLGNAILRPRQGREMLFTMSAAPIRREDGTVAGAIVVFRDVTQEKRQEEEMIKSARIESLGLLAGGIAHDFNNLLTAMLGNVSLAKMLAEPGSKVHSLLGQTEKASVRARHLTQQLLTFAKGGTPVKSLVSLQGLLVEAADFALSGSQVKCAFELAEDLWPVEVDEGQFAQVIQNLLLNAVQAMPAGGGVRITGENLRLTADAIPALPAGRYVRIAVRDRGRGIAKQDMGKIFDPYFTTKELGHGLGLTICYSIIQKHHGHIAVESQEGEGTTFLLYLPASEKRFAAPATSREKREAEGPGRGRILVMDDEDVVRDVAAQMITFLGYQVAESRDGEEALAMYAAAREAGRPFDAVLMDLTIPGGLGGKETMEKLLVLDPGVRGIVSSGYANDPIMADYRRYGFCGVAPKPYSMKELAAALETVLKDRDLGY
jgi:two-component system, cell cycle sensor histidine kinase and response regulator CckA